RPSSNLLLSGSSRRHTLLSMRPKETCKVIAARFFWPHLSKSSHRNPPPPPLFPFPAANLPPVLSRGSPAEPSARRSRDKPGTLRQTCIAASALHRQRRTGGRPARAVRRTE